MKTTPTLYFTAAALTAVCVSTSVRAAEPTAPVTPHWESSAAAGLTLTRGNSDTLLGTLSLGTGKKWDQNELTMGADGAYGNTKDQKTKESTTSAQSLKGFLQYNRLFTEHWYGYGRVEGLYDKVADVKYRLTLSPGAGYYFIKEKTTDLSAEVGPGYVFQKLGNDSSSYATIRVAEKGHYALSDRARVWEMVEYLPKIDDFTHNYIINSEIGIEADLSSSKKMSLRTTLQDIYNNAPAKGREKNDAKLIAAIAYKF
jgi:putative salt-induced outer membrane protein YdiY